jgi:hypothetical protein
LIKDPSGATWNWLMFSVSLCNALAMPAVGTRGPRNASMRIRWVKVAVVPRYANSGLPPAESGE